MRMMKGKLPLTFLVVRTRSDGDHRGSRVRPADVPDHYRLAMFDQWMYGGRNDQYGGGRARSTRRGGRSGRSSGVRGRG